jgi:hypothetical protein
MEEYKRADIYFVAHADDWQLFMDPEISKSMADKTCKVIIVHTTAGDAGSEDRYWKAREFASQESILFRVSVDGHLHRKTMEWTDRQNRKHSCMVFNNCYCYFLRLPDGAYDGRGFERYDHQSLEKLRTGIIRSLARVDGEYSYTGWDDLTSTIDHIIQMEIPAHLLEDRSGVCLNIPEYENELSPYDHNDHYNTSLLVQGTKSYGLYRKRAFVGYHIKNNHRLLSEEELFWKIGMFSSYQQSLFREYGHSTISEDPSYITWCFRNCSFREL